MKNLFLTIALMLATVSIRAQKISHIETTKSWYYVYDDNGKKIKTISTSAGELKGYSANFYIIQQGSWVYTYDPKGKKLHTCSTSTVGAILSVTGDTFTTRKGAWIYTWSKEGKKLNTRAAQQ